MKRLFGFPAALLLLGLGSPSAAVAGVAEWTTHGPPMAMGRVIVDPTTGALYEGTAQGLYRSTDDGASWTAVCPSGDVHAFTARAGVVYSGSGGKLYQSLDSGAHCRVLSEVSDSGIGELVADPADPATLYRLRDYSVQVLPHNSISYNRLEVSADTGTSWTDVGSGIEPPLGQFTEIEVPPGMPGTVYAALGAFFTSSLSSTLWKSTDRGAHWSLLNDSIGEDFLYSLVIDPFVPTTLYASLALSNLDGVLRSTDGGVMFSRVSSEPVGLMVADPVRPGHLYGTENGRGVFQSSDGGATWVPMNRGLTDQWPGTLAIDPTGATLHASATSGVFDYGLGADADVLSLNGAHSFSVTLAAKDPRTGRMGDGVAVRVNDLWGYFSLPSITGDPRNPEVFVKILDGTALNGHYWFFFGGLTDLEYTLTVEEDSTGATRTYTKPASSECGGSDTEAF